MTDMNREEELLKAALREHEQELDKDIACFEREAANSVTPPSLDAKIQALIRGKRKTKDARRRLPGWVWAAATAACLLLFISLGSAAGLFRQMFGASSGAPAAPADMAETPAQEAGEPAGETGEDQPRWEPGWLPEGFVATEPGSWANEAGQYLRISTEVSLAEAELAQDKTYEWLTLDNGLWYLKETGGEWELISYAVGFPIAIHTDLPREEALRVAENLLFT